MANSNVYNRQVASGIVPDATTGLLPDPVRPSDILGRVRTLYASIVFVNADAAGNHNVAILPLGARVLDAKFNVVNALAAGNSTLGDAGDGDRYIAAVSTAAVGQAGSIADAGFGFRIDTEANRTILLNTAADPVDADQIDVYMQFVID